MPSPEPADQGAAIVAEAEPRAGPGVFQNSIINVVGLVAIHGIGALAGLVSAKVLGPFYVGVLAVAFGIGEFGRAISACTHIPSIVQYHAGKPAGVVFGSSLAVKVLLGGLFLGLVVAALPLLSSTFSIPSLLMVMATSVLVFGSIFEVGAARLEAENKMVRSNLVLASGSIVMITGISALALLGELTIYTSAATTITANLVMSVLAFRFARPSGRLAVDRRLAVEMTKQGLRIVSASLLTQGLLWTDTLLVSYLLGNEQAGIYNIVFIMTYAMVLASSAMGVALVPALSRLAASGQDTSTGYHRGTIIALAMSGAMAVLYVLSGKLLLGLYGDPYVAGYPALIVLTVFGVAAALTVPAATMLTIHGRAGLLSILSLAQLVVNVPLNYYMIQHYGILGASIATTAVFCMGTILSWSAVRITLGAWPMSLAAIREARAFALAQLDRLRA